MNAIWLKFPKYPFFFAPKQAFTLVELIVVISVLGVLATIAFTQISNVTQSARNSTRMTNIQSISSSLNIYKATNGTYPIPDNKTDILYSGTTIWYQWYIKDTAARLLKLSPNTSQDPLNTSSYFSYATNQSRTHAQLLSFLEANTTSFKALPVTFASDELATKTPYSKGEELGILYTSGTTTPLSGVSVDLNTLTNPYTAYYNSTDSLSWTGNLLQNLVISYAHGSGFGSPSADDCPTGFIPVPGNKDFNQPGFCVAKYEMKQAIGDAGSYIYTWGIWQSLNKNFPYCTNTSLCNWTGARNFTYSVVSKASGYPITHINQYNAIEACKAMGVGYHLITNNEWMTISRNIEQVSSNWSDGIVWTGYLYNGHTDNYPANILEASTDDGNGYYQTADSETSPWDAIQALFSTGSAQAYKGQKRTLALSNGSIIWDLSGNLWEHVNKTNSFNGVLYDGSTPYGPSICTGTGWHSYFAPEGIYPECAYAQPYSKSKVGPLTSQTNGYNGVGRVYSYITPIENIFLRGGYWADSMSAWVFAIWTRTDAPYADRSTGFRCAK